MERDQILELRQTVQRFIRLFGLLEQSVTPCGYSLSLSQVFALQELEKQKITIGELSDRLHLDRSTGSRLVDSLVKGGFVQRELNEANRREVLASLTERGQRSIQQVREQSVSFYESVLKGLSKEEQTQILRSFQTFTDSLSKVRREQNES